MKPKRFSEHKTISEVCRELDIDRRWIERLEKAGRIPRAARVSVGSLKVRLWSPEQVEEMKEIISTHRVGRPSNG